MLLSKEALKTWFIIIIITLETVIFQNELLQANNIMWLANLVFTNTWIQAVEKKTGKESENSA